MATNAWEKKDPVNGYDPTSDGSSPSQGNICAYDPNDQKVKCVQGDNYIFQSYVYSTNTWTKHTNYGTTVVGYATTAVVDPQRQVMFFFGSNGSGSLRIHSISLASGTTYAVTDLHAGSSGCSAIGVDWPGVTLDTSRGLIAIYPNNGNSIYLYNPDTGVCSAHTLASGPPTATTSGTFGRFRYVPALGKYVVCLDTNANCYTLTPERSPISGNVKSSGKVSLQ